MSGSISRLVLAIMSKDTRETLERWQFDVKMEGAAAGPGGESSAECVCGGARLNPTRPD